MTLEIREIIGNKRRNPATKWTIEIMSGAIVGLKENGEPINMRYLQINYKGLSAGIENYPGSWKRVVIEAGYNPNEETAAARNRLILKP